jgi:hypothetical protein
LETWKLKSSTIVNSHLFLQMPAGPWHVIAIWSKEGTICGQIISKSETYCESKSIACCLKTKEYQKLRFEKSRFSSSLLPNHSRRPGLSFAQANHKIPNRPTKSWPRLPNPRPVPQIRGQTTNHLPLFLRGRLDLCRKVPYGCQMPDARRVLFEN